jgi:hypothetical protein
VTSALFAHQGGWDEALLVLVPIGLFVGLLLLANKRAKAIQAKRQAERQTPETGQPDAPTSENH